MIDSWTDRLTKPLIQNPVSRTGRIADAYPDWYVTQRFAKSRSVGLVVVEYSDDDKLLDLVRPDYGFEYLDGSLVTLVAGRQCQIKHNINEGRSI